MCSINGAEGDEMKGTRMGDGGKGVYYIIDAAALNFLRSKITDLALTRTFERAARDGPVHEQERYSTARLLMRLDEQERETLLDHLSTLLCEIGLQPDSEPNDIGRRIEELIDNFSGT